MSTYSPAPWRENITDEGVLSVVMDENHAVTFGDLEDTCGTCHANAALTAAAPELLDACQRACDFIDSMIAQWNEYDDEYLEDKDRAMLNNLRAAIAKAVQP